MDVDSVTGNSSPAAAGDLVQVDPTSPSASASVDAGAAAPDEQIDVRIEGPEEAVVLRALPSPRQPAQQEMSLTILGITHGGRGVSTASEGQHTPCRIACKIQRGRRGVFLQL